MKGTATMRNNKKYLHNTEIVLLYLLLAPAALAAVAVRRKPFIYTRPNPSTSLIAPMAACNGLVPSSRRSRWCCKRAKRWMCFGFSMT